MNLVISFIQDLAVILCCAAAAGLLCKRAGLSPLVGYLLAGVVVGPHTPPHALVTDLDRVQLFAQLGMVFLMFGIGLGFSLRRLRQLGLPVVAATIGTALLVFTLARLGGVALGLDRTGTAFFAGMVVVSSSVVIGKLLTDAGRAHEKSSQLALGITLCEDLVAIVLLTVLGTYAQFGPEQEAMPRAELWQTLGLFVGFVLVLATAGLLLVPRVLARLSREANPELETLFVAGLLFSLSLMVVWAGYSMALGAFLLGAIVAETPQRPGIERAFGGLRDVFGAVFFVAIGMTIDWRVLPDAILPMLAATALALFGRSAASALLLMLLGHDARTAWRAGLIVTPLGEFSFIIAQLGIGSALLPPEYMGAAVGSALLTALVSPVLVRHNDAIARRLSGLRPPVAGAALATYRRLLDTLQRRREQSLLWRLLRRRFIQIGLEVALISAVLAFAEPLIDRLVAWVGPEQWPGVTPAMGAWIVLGLVLLAPFIAILRNFNAVAMIVVDDVITRRAAPERWRAGLTLAIQAVGVAGLLLWIWNFVPAEARLWSILVVVALLTGLAALLWRRMIFWHSNLEVSLEASIGTSPGEIVAARSSEWMDRYALLGLQITEIVLPDNFAQMGRSLAEVDLRARFGCAVIGIDRQSFTIPNPGPGSHLYPGDRLLVLGGATEVAAAREFLVAPSVREVPSAAFGDLVLETVTLPDESSAAGQTLRELGWAQQFGVQVVGRWKGEACVLNPGANTRVGGGDRLLVLGTPKQLSTLRRTLADGSGSSR